MKKFPFLICLLFSLSVFSQSGDETAIRKVMDDQTKAWNRGDLNGFMKGYWENDSLMFLGKRGINYGWKNTLESYKKGYPDTASMGKLSFNLLVVKRLSDEYFEVIGEWKLIRSIGDVGGFYTLLFRKINNEWVIVLDHSS